MRECRGPPSWASTEYVCIKAVHTGIVNPYTDIFGVEVKLPGAWMCLQKPDGYLSHPTG